MAEHERLCFWQARVSDVAMKVLAKMTRYTESEELRAYAHSLIVKDNITLKVAKQTWSVAMFYGAMLTIGLMFVFVWLQSFATSL